MEGLLLDATSGLLPLVLLRMDARVACCLFAFTNVKIVDDHSGYALPWDPLQRLFPNNARFHDLHHEPKYARFNLSQPFFTFWDRVGGTLYREPAAAAAATAAVKGAAAAGGGGGSGALSKRKVR